jgi:hypothetical protein
MKIQYILKYSYQNQDQGVADIFDDLNTAIEQFRLSQKVLPYNRYELYQAFVEETPLEIPEIPEPKHTVTFQTYPNPEIIGANAVTQEALDWIDQHSQFYNNEATLFSYEKEARQTLKRNFHLHINQNYDFEEVLTHLATFPGAQIIRHIPEVQESRPQYHWSLGKF